MSCRSVLIHSYAKKNKSRRKKYFVLSICSNYSEPRLDYFYSKEKWNQKKHEVENNNSENISFQSIDLSNLFFIDELHQSKSKENRLDLYLESRHFSLVFQSEDWKKKWREKFENIIYKNSKLKSFCKIEYVLDVSIRVKPKENIDKSVYSQLRGRFRACFTKSFLMFVNVSLEKPALTIEYPFIRQWESRYDGTLRLEIGRAASIGECILILEMADCEESNAAHLQLTTCIRSFKLTRPEPPKIRSSCDKQSKRMSIASGCSKPFSSTSNMDFVAKRHESCFTFGTESVLDSSSDFTTEGDYVSTKADSSYVPMNGYSGPGASPNKSKNGLDYFEHTNRIYKCPTCGSFTKLVMYCSRCSNHVNLNSLSLLCKSDSNHDPNSFEFQRQLFEPTRNKAQSLTEKPNLFALNGTYKVKQFLSYPNKATTSSNSKSSSKTSTNDASCSSKQESQNSLAISANRHDDEIFMELDFDNLDSRMSSNKKLSSYNRQKFQLKCANCSTSLIHKTPGENVFEKRCVTCFQELVIFSIHIKDSEMGSDWYPRTTSLLPTVRLRGPVECKPKSNSEYVDMNSADTTQTEPSVHANIYNDYH